MPSTSAKCRFITGKSASARTTANPIRCVKEIFPPRVRRSWLLITRRLSASSFAGTARTLVAVGTFSDASMFFTTADAAPRSGVAALLPVPAGLAAREVAPAAGLSGAEVAFVFVAADRPVAPLSRAVGRDRHGGAVGGPGPFGRLPPLWAAASGPGE